MFLLAGAAAHIHTCMVCRRDVIGAAVGIGMERRRSAFSQIIFSQTVGGWRFGVFAINTVQECRRAIFYRRLWDCDWLRRWRLFFNNRFGFLVSASMRVDQARDLKQGKG